MPVEKSPKGGYKVHGAKTPKHRMTYEEAEAQRRAIEASKHGTSKPRKAHAVTSHDGKRMPHKRHHS